VPGDRVKRVLDPSLASPDTAPVFVESYRCGCSSACPCSRRATKSARATTRGYGLRKALGPVYEQFDRSHWREDFEEACQAVEVLSRKYINDGIAAGRIVLITKAGNIRTLTPQKIDKLTLGQLAEAFA
jgi:hypothetical protein